MISRKEVSWLRERLDHPMPTIESHQQEFNSRRQEHLGSLVARAHLLGSKLAHLPAPNQAFSQWPNLYRSPELTLITATAGRTAIYATVDRSEAIPRKRLAIGSNHGVFVHLTDQPTVKSELNPFVSVGFDHTLPEEIVLVGSDTRIVLNKSAELRTVNLLLDSLASYVAEETRNLAVS